MVYLRRVVEKMARARCTKGKEDKNRGDCAPGFLKGKGMAVLLSLRV